VVPQTAANIKLESTIEKTKRFMAVLPCGNALTRQLFRLSPRPSCLQAIEMATDRRPCLFRGAGAGIGRDNVYEGRARLTALNEQSDFALAWMNAVQAEEHIAYWVGTSCPFPSRYPCIVAVL
jgi:hypothetical protein